MPFDPNKQGLFDAQCDKCRRRYGWRGTIKDNPGCPNCKAAANPLKLIMPFGKYKGRPLGEIADADLLYVDWLNDPERRIRDRSLVMAVAQICTDRAAEIDSLLDSRGD